MCPTLLLLLLLCCTPSAAPHPPCAHIAYAACGPCCAYVQTRPGTMIVERTAAAFLAAFAARVGCLPTVHQLNATYLCDGDYARVPP